MEKMKGCPFCDFDEGWVKETSYQKPIRYIVECAVCKARGPESLTHDGAIKKWNGMLKDIDDEKRLKKAINEDAMGGVSAPMSTLNNTPGMGNVTPGSLATHGIGSGDNFGSKIGKMNTQTGTPKKKKKKPMKKRKYVKEDLNSIDEENISPYDKIGMSMAKKMKVKPPFKKKKEKGNQNAIAQQKFEHQIVPFDEFTKLLNEEKYPQGQYKKDKDHLYMFTIYLKDGEKYFTDYYTLEDAKKMKSMLKAKGESFQAFVGNADDNYVDEINL